MCEWLSRLSRMHTGQVLMVNTSGRHRRLGSSRRDEERGAVAVEFALVFGFILVPLLFGMLQYGWYLYTAQVTSSAVRETARRLSVGDCQGSVSGQLKAQTFARNQSGFRNMTVTYGSTASPTSNTLPAEGQVLRVTATANGAIVGYLPLPDNGIVTRRVEIRVEDSTEDTTCP